MADTSAGGSVTLRGQITIPNWWFAYDVWGWVDPATQIEYAAIGDLCVGLAIIDVSDPTDPFVVATMDTIPPPFDPQVWEHYLYTVDGSVGGPKGRVIDISDPANPVVVGYFETCHTLLADPRGYLYAERPGLKVYDLNPDPTSPALVWEKVTTTGHDCALLDNRLYDFHGDDGTFIYDMTDPTSPDSLCGIVDPRVIFHHSGSPTPDGNFVFINDEWATNSQPDLWVWDISNLAAPVVADSFFDSTATVFNSYCVGNFLHVSYGSAGYRVFDVSNPFDICLADEYDTSPDAVETMDHGAFGCYPFAPSGNVYVTDKITGFYVFSFEPNPTGIRRRSPSAVSLRQNVPNPFNPGTTIAFELFATTHVNLTIYDAAGRRVRLLLDEERVQGEHRISWDGLDDDGAQVASGVYFYSLTSSGARESRRMVLLR